MAARRFFKMPAGITVREIAALTGAEPIGDARLDLVITDIAQLDQAGPSDLAFLDGAKYTPVLQRSRAGACLMAERFEQFAPPHVTVLRAKQPYVAFGAMARRLYPEALRPDSLFETRGIAPGAIVHPSARLEPGVTVDPRAVIGPRAAIGAGTVIAASARIGPDVRIGRNCSIGAGASVMHALIGDHVILHPGCSLGHSGFRFDSSPQGHIRAPQLGRVIVQDDVEIGANTTIDRGQDADTVIGEGTKIDNLVQIGHNVVIGRHCIIVAECGLSPGVVLGDYVVLGGQVGIAGNLKIGERAMIGACGGVAADVPAGERWLGFPALPSREAFRMAMTLHKRG